MSLKKNVIANYLGNAWSSIIGLIFLPIYIKYMGMESYGLIGLFAVLQSSLTLVDSGMTPALSREMSRFTGGKHSSQSIRDLLRSLEIICLAFACCYASAVWAASDWLATNWLKVEKLPIATVTQAFSIMGIVTALRLLEGLYRGSIIGLQKQVLFNFVNSGIATFRNLGAVLLLAYVSPTIFAYFLWQAFISLLTVFAFAAITYTNLPEAERPGQFSKAELVKVWRFSAGMFATTVLVLLLTQVDKLILSRILTLEAFGQYTLASTIATSLLLLVAPTTQAHYPKLTEMHSNGNIEALKTIYHRGAQLITAIAGTAACIIFCFGGRLIVIWTGNEELALNIGNLLKVMTLGTLFNSFMNMPYMLQLSFGWSSFAAKVNFVAVLFLVPAVLLVTPVYGAIGAAWIWVTLNASYVFISSYFMHKVILPTEKTRWFINDLLKPFAASAAIVMFFWLIKPAYTSKAFDIMLIASAAITGTVASLMASSELRTFILNNRFVLAEKN